MRQPTLMPGGFIPPVKRSQPRVARTGNIYRTDVWLMNGQHVRFRIHSDTHAVAAFRSELLYGHAGILFISTRLIGGTEPLPERTTFLQRLGRATRRLLNMGQQ